MSRVRVHNFSISLDGFGTGEGQSLEEPFGHAGNRLHEWFFPTRTFQGIQGKAEGAPASTMPSRATGPPASAPRSWGGTSSGPSVDHGLTRSGRDGGATTRPSTRRCSSSPTTPGPRSRWRAGRRSISSTPRPAEALDAAREAAGGLDVRIGGGPTNRSPVRSCRSCRLHAHRDRAHRSRPRRTPLGRP